MIAHARWIDSRYLLCVLTAGTLATFAVAGPSDSSVSFHRDVRPILQARCTGCHQPAKSSGDLVLVSVERLLAGGESGPAIEPGDADSSLLIEQITPIDGEAAMPPEGSHLSDAEVAILRRWIEQGATDDTPPIAIARYDAQHPPHYPTPPLITSLDLSPDGRLMAIAGFHEVLLRETTHWKLVGRFIGQAERIERIRFSPDGQRLAVAGGLPGRMGELQIWNVAEQELELSVPIGFDTVYGVSWSPDGGMVALGTPQNMLIGIDAKSGQQVLLMRGHTDWVLDTVFSRGGEYLVSVGRDMTAKLTRVKTEQFLDNITSITPGALRGGLHAVALHPQREEVLVGGADGVPQIYRLHRETARQIGDNANLVRRFPATAGRIWSVAFDPNGKRIATASGLDGQGFVDIYSSDFDPAIPDAVRKAFDKVAESRSAEEHAAVEAYVTANVDRLHGIKIDHCECYTLAFDPTGSFLAVAGADGHIRLIDVASGAIVNKFLAVPIDSVPDTSIPTSAVATAINRKKGVASEGRTPACDPADVVNLTIDPPIGELHGPFAYQQFLVTAHLSNGEQVDVTREVMWESDPPESITITPGGLLRALRGEMHTAAESGTISLRARWGAREATAMVNVSKVDEELPPDYVRDIAPLVSRLGCNAGTCHGAKDGKAGFKLSLRGYDPVFDLRSLTGEHASRRINVSSPDNSLALLKATAAVPHEGGMVTEWGSDYYRQLRAWIAAGAQLDVQSHRPERIEVRPQNPVLPAADSQQQFRVVAYYPDGTQRDVTQESFIESGNSEVATHDDFGLITALRRGEAPILARYEGCYVATTLTVMGDRADFQWESPESWGAIDDLVARKWERLKIRPSDLCSDTEFLRRVHFDLTGLPPTPQQITAFVLDARPPREKRNEVIEQLIGSPEFVDYWSNKWGDLLQVHSRYLGAEGALRFRDWIRGQVESNVPYDQFVYQILTASGSNFDHPAASYYKILRTPDLLLENTTHLFLATRFNCNKCHDHPFERWTQDQYYQTGAYFAQVAFKADEVHSGDKRVGGSAVEGSQPLFERVEDVATGEFVHERTGQVATPLFPYAAPFECSADASRRQQFAHWLTSPDNRYFATSYANRLWAYLVGVGIIEPIDDIRAGNPPTNPELLEHLTDQFVQSGFDVRHLIRLICQSRTYQLSMVTNRWNEDDRQNFSHAIARRLPAEVLFDSVCAVTGSTPRIPGTAEGTRAMQLADGQIDVPSGLLANLGRPARESACECERVNDVHLGAVMGLLNGPEIAAAIADPDNALSQLERDEPDDRRLIEKIYLRVLNRSATEPEIATVLQSWSRIPSDHERLVRQMAEQEADWTMRKDVLVRQRLEQIGQAEAAIADYMPTHVQQMAQAQSDQRQRIVDAEALLEQYGTTIAERTGKWETALGVEPFWTRWTLLAPATAVSSGDVQLAVQPDRSILASGKVNYCTYTMEIPFSAVALTGIAIQALPHDALPNFGPGLASNGNFVVSEVELAWRSGDATAKEQLLPLVNAQVDFNQEGFDIKRTVNQKRERDDLGWAVNGKERRPHLARFQLEQRHHAESPGTLIVRIYCQYGNGDHPLGCFQLLATDSSRPLAAGIRADLAEIVTRPPEQRSIEQTQLLRDYVASRDEKQLELHQAVVQARQPLPADSRLVELQQLLDVARRPIAEDPNVVRMRQDVEQSAAQIIHVRRTAVQDLAWALINTSEFLFNH